MRGRKTLLHVVSTAEERDQLEQRLRCTTTSLGLALRCRAIPGGSPTGGRWSRSPGGDRLETAE
jgi:hypothetical protein